MTTEANRMAQLIKLAVEQNQFSAVESITTDKIVYVWNNGTVSTFTDNEFLHKADNLKEAAIWAKAHGYEINFTEK